MFLGHNALVILIGFALIGFAFVMVMAIKFGWLLGEAFVKSRLEKPKPAPTKNPVKIDSLISIRGKVVSIIVVVLGLPTSAGIKGSTKLSELSVDSLDVVEITMSIEENLGVEITVEEEEKLSLEATIDEISFHVWSKIA